jgi:hypothetical protein
MTTKKTRAPMTKPTKAQLAARLAYFEQAFKDLTTFTTDCDEPVSAEVVQSLAQDILDSAPSLAPVVNTPPADASENLAEGEELVEVEVFVSEEAAE